MSNSLETRKLETYPNTYLTFYKLGTKICIDRDNPEDHKLKGIYIPSWLLGRAIEFLRKPKMGTRLNLSKYRYLGVERIRAAASKKTEGYTFRVYSEGYSTKHWIHVPKNKVEELVETLKEFSLKE